jgi:hypothetical protein
MNGGEGTRNIRSCNRARGILYSSLHPPYCRTSCPRNIRSMNRAGGTFYSFPTPSILNQKFEGQDSRGPATSEASTEQAVSIFALRARRWGGAARCGGGGRNCGHLVDNHSKRSNRSQLSSLCHLARPWRRRCSSLEATAIAISR